MRRPLPCARLAAMRDAEADLQAAASRLAAAAAALHGYGQPGGRTRTAAASLRSGTGRAAAGVHGVGSRSEQAGHASLTSAGSWRRKSATWSAAMPAGLTGALIVPAELARRELHELLEVSKTNFTYRFEFCQCRWQWCGLLPMLVSGFP